jgi:hypothetical protein
MTRTQACKEEICRLHKFFVNWFTGALPNTEEEFLKGVSGLAPSFHLISPRGSIDGHQSLLESLRKAHGIHMDDGFDIDIRNCQLMHDNESTIAMTYEEWQHTATSTPTGRISTVLFQVIADEQEKDGEILKWLHVHETWLPDGKESA